MLATILAEFTSRWDEGRRPRAEEFAGRLPAGRPADVVELVYHEFCLAESSGLDPDPDEYLGRFPAVREPLNRLLLLHGTIDASQLRGFVETADLPAVGDEIGPYRLVRELGRGGFARVFLAEQADLDDRLIVLKVSRQITPEPRLLAQDRHPNIVEIFWHRLVEDGTLQLICMPFLGGATLAAIVSGWGQSGARPTSGRDLLAILDRASAPEYPRSDADRPARALIARLSYPRAIAWIVARLAEALDHAFVRGVAHGDIKPSNILLTGDGVPMLLDFNLAVGWQYPNAADATGDPGGTLVYMSPERLRGIADPSQVDPPRVTDRHRADLFSLGMVLLETLTGRPPELAEGPARTQAELASAYSRTRAQGGEAMIRASRAPIAPALRSILARCLAFDPADRYKRGSELADDLDRWRTDRALAFAKEPTCRFALLRWARRQRVALVAAALSLAVAASATLAVSVSFRGTQRQKAMTKWTHLLTHADAGVFRSHRVGHWTPGERIDPAEASLRHLEYYDVTGPGDWRQNDDVRNLPEPDRIDLEAWLLEQILRYTRALGDRPDSPADWRRGLALLERTVAAAPFEPFLARGRLLARSLELPDPWPQGVAGAAPSPRGMEEYLLGVDAEPTRAHDALSHYRTFLATCPASFWGHYRAASAAHRLGEYGIAAHHLKYCLARRPESAPLHGQLAGCLFKLRRYDDALEECDRALALDPDQAECYRTRAYIRKQLGQRESDDLKSDISRFEVLTRHLGKAPSLRLGLESLIDQEPDDSSAQFNGLSLRRPDIDPEDGDLRTQLALDFWKDKRYDDALAELDDILRHDPENLKARHMRATLLHGLKREQAEGDFAFLLRNPRREEFLRNFERIEDVTAVHSFISLSKASFRLGEIHDALMLAERGLARALQVKMDQDLAQRNLTRLRNKASLSNPEQSPLAGLHIPQSLGQMSEEPRTSPTRTNVPARYPSRRMSLERP